MLVNGLSNSTKDEYCMYLRKSRAYQEAEARGEGETLARHEKILLQLARKLNEFIALIYLSYIKKQMQETDLFKNL